MRGCERERVPRFGLMHAGEAAAGGERKLAAALSSVLESAQLGSRDSRAASFIAVGRA